MPNQSDDMYKKEIEVIGSIIDSVVEKMGIDRKLNTSNIFNHWDEIAGREIAKRSKPRKITRETLYVSVTSSTWANELSLMSEELIKKINSFVGEKVVKTVRFKQIFRDSCTYFSKFSIKIWYNITW